MKTNQLISHWANIFESENLSEISDMSNVVPEYSPYDFTKGRTYLELKDEIKNSRLKENWEKILKNPKYFIEFDLLPLVNCRLNSYTREETRATKTSPSDIYEYLDFTCEFLDDSDFSYEGKCNLIDILLVLDSWFGKGIEICIQDFSYGDINVNQYYTSERKWVDQNDMLFYSAENGWYTTDKSERTKLVGPLFPDPDMKNKKEFENLINDAFGLKENANSIKISTLARNLP